MLPVLVAMAYGYHGIPGFQGNGDLITVLPENATVVSDCHVMSDTVGPKKNPVWLHITSPQEGYMTDFYSSSKWDRNNMSGLPPKCGAQASAPNSNSRQGQPNNAKPNGETIKSIAYDRAATVKWARKHAKDVPPHDASCTWFASNALWKGGLPKTPDWTDEGPGYGFAHQHRPGTKAAWAVDLFRDYINKAYPQSTEYKLNSDAFRKNKLPKAQLGDVILYDWEGDGVYNHAAVITDIAPGSYPEVTEWSAYDGRIPSTYVERGWTWSEKNKKWLQDYFPNIQAILLHIDTTQTGTF